MATTPQTFQNHTKFVPLFHFVLLPLLLVNVLVAAYHAWQQPSAPSVWAVLFGIGLILSALFARTFALAAQDRVIRLEERLRMREILPADLQARVGDFSTNQLIGLRFASDEELPSLAARVLRDNIEDRTAIKKMVQQWRADNCRL